MPTGKRLDDSTKQEIVNRASKGEDIEDLAKEYGFSTWSFQKWKGKFKGGTSKAKKKITTKKTARKNPLKVENENLKRELEFWKNSFTELLRRNNLE